MVDKIIYAQFLNIFICSSSEREPSINKMGMISKQFYFCQKLIDHIRIHSQSACYATSMPAPVAQQVMSTMEIIMGKNGTDEGL